MFLQLTGRQIGQVQARAVVVAHFDLRLNAEISVRAAA